MRKPRILFVAMQASPEAIATADRRPLPDDLNVLREIIGGRPADPQTMQRLITCNLVEEFDGTALLTTRGIRAASLLSPTSLGNEMVLISPLFDVHVITATLTVLVWADAPSWMTVVKKNRQTVSDHGIKRCGCFEQLLLHLAGQSRPEPKCCMA